MKTIASTARPLPGPWTVEGNPMECNAEVRAGAQGLVAIVWSGRRADYQTALANARLLAAAPDLVAALAKAVRCMEFAANALQVPEASAFREDLASAHAALAKVQP